MVPNFCRKKSPETLFKAKLSAIFALKMRSITSRTSELGIIRALGCKDSTLVNKILIDWFYFLTHRVQEYMHTNLRV